MVLPISAFCVTTIHGNGFFYKQSTTSADYMADCGENDNKSVHGKHYLYFITLSTCLFVLAAKAVPFKLSAIWRSGKVPEKFVRKGVICRDPLTELYTENKTLHTY